mmetsp:Transcript_25616/g.67000  ORF Transcript_25616/g.67000 Transcript_25616/m.67000 type:complete len:410 (-) Transcript_25616:2173-3402(-)
MQGLLPSNVQRHILNQSCAIHEEQRTRKAHVHLVQDFDVHCGRGLTRAGRDIHLLHSNAIPQRAVLEHDGFSFRRRGRPFQLRPDADAVANHTWEVEDAHTRQGRQGNRVAMPGRCCCVLDVEFADGQSVQKHKSWPQPHSRHNHGARNTALRHLRPTMETNPSLSVRAHQDAWLDALAHLTLVAECCTCGRLDADDDTGGNGGAMCTHKRFTGYGEDTVRRQVQARQTGIRDIIPSMPSDSVAGHIVAQNSRLTEHGGACVDLEDLPILAVETNVHGQLGVVVQAYGRRKEQHPIRSIVVHQFSNEATLGNQHRPRSEQPQRVGRWPTKQLRRHFSDEIRQNHVVEGLPLRACRFHHHLLDEIRLWRLKGQDNRLATEIHHSVPCSGHFCVACTKHSGQTRKEQGPKP